MARPISKEEFAKLVNEQYKALSTLPDGAFICPTCHTIFRPKDRKVCWCDYESPAIGRE